MINCINCINCKTILNLNDDYYYWCYNKECKIKCIWFYDPINNYKNQYTYYVDDYRILISNSNHFLSDDLLICDGIYLSQQNKIIRSKKFIELDKVDDIIKNSIFL